jgi:hypothetical protein
MFQNVKFADATVKLVKTTKITVPNVLKEESDSHNVVVTMVTMMLVVMVANHVLINVSPVKDLLTIVLFVPPTDNQLQIVNVNSLPVTMKLEDKLTVHHVTTNVTPVLLTPPVKNVLTTLTELLNQIVDVLTDTLKLTPKFVLNVTVDVTLVLIMLKTV